jgi:hypothetical protein
LHASGTNGTLVTGPYVVPEQRPCHRVFAPFDQRWGAPRPPEAAPQRESIGFGGSAKAEERQDGDDDDDCTNQVNDAVHLCSSFVAVD